MCEMAKLLCRNDDCKDKFLGQQVSRNCDIMKNTGVCPGSHCWTWASDRKGFLCAVCTAALREKERLAAEAWQRDNGNNGGGNNGGGQTVR
ncbi:hypothetical protein VTL71DRAFT_43 [Oculimacula yallundae]|uniref:Uncharacterized protein n=1 Tax=Oculimacula yallundae TaxID=86028 RepID=A0ABR4CZ10_9HELO